MEQVKFYHGDGELHVVSPYHPDFLQAAKKIGGKWSGKVWVFDARDEERVRDLVKSIYGFDDRESDVALVTIKLEVGAITEQTYWRFGRQVLVRPGRDRAVRLGTGVIIVDGEFPGSGGSARYPQICPARFTKYTLGSPSEDITPTVTLEVRDVPKSMFEQDDGDGILEVVEQNQSATPPAKEQFLSILRERMPMLTDDVIIVTRHQGVVEWLRLRGIVGEVVAHAAAEDVRDKHVYGNLPLFLAAEAARVTIVSLPGLKPEQRGKDLSPAEMDTAGARLDAFEVRRV